MRLVRALPVIAVALLACDGDAGGDDAGGRGDATPTTIDAGPRCAPAAGLDEPLICNGDAALCDRTFDDVSFPATHNAMSSVEDGWAPPNQQYALWRQLEDGVRGFMLDIYEQHGEVLLCHGFCALGSRPFVEALAELRLFMDCHPAEVITLILESYVDEPGVEASFQAAGLMTYLHAQPLGDPWPTLRAMIESGRRMLVLTERADVTSPWHHYAYEYGWDNDYAAATAADFDCAPNRGTGTEDLFILNHFLTAPIAMRALAEMVNVNPVLSDHAEGCRAERGQLPNFVTVDFYDAGDLFTVVDTLNGL